MPKHNPRTHRVRVEQLAPGARVWKFACFSRGHAPVELHLIENCLAAAFIQIHFAQSGIGRGCSFGFLKTQDALSFQLNGQMRRNFNEMPGSRPQVFHQIKVRRDFLAQQLKLDATPLNSHGEVFEGGLVGRVTPCAPQLDRAGTARRGLTRPTGQPLRRHLAHKFPFRADNAHHPRNRPVQRGLILATQQWQQLVANPVALDVKRSVARILAKRDFVFRCKREQFFLR